MSPSIGILGASGRVGRLLLQQAIEEGYDDVRVLIRNKEKLKSVLSATITDKINKVVEGSSTDPKAIQNLVDGMDGEDDVVLSCVGGKNYVVSSTVKAVKQLQEESNAPWRFVQLTSVGLGSSSVQLPALSWMFAYLFKPVILKTIYDDLEIAEDMMKMGDEDVCSSKKFILFRPPGLSDGPGSGNFGFYQGDDVDAAKNMYKRVGASMPRADVAKAMLSLVKDRTWDGKCVSVMDR